MVAPDTRPAECGARTLQVAEVAAAEREERNAPQVAGIPEPAAGEEARARGEARSAASETVTWSVAGAARHAIAERATDAAARRGVAEPATDAAPRRAVAERATDAAARRASFGAAQREAVTQDAAASAHADRAGGRPRQRLASLTRRLGALGYEVLLLVAMAFVAGFLFLPFLSRDASHQTLTVPSHVARALMFGALAAGAGLYYTWCWSGGRRTLPQKTWQLRLVDRRGAAPARARALIRYAAFWIGPALALIGYAALHAAGYGRNALAFGALNYCWAIVDPDRQFLHDRIAGTFVVQDSWNARQ